MKAFHVVANWHTFRVPCKGDHTLFSKAERWCKHNCSGGFKIFYIKHGLQHNAEKNEDYVYTPLIQIDLLSSTDAALFKIEWC